MAAVREKLLTASDLASLCEVDLKTIHNWVDRGRIPHFRTPGRHLRFRAADVAEFLRAWGYSVPRELARATSKSLMVVGSKDVFAHVTRSIGEGLPVKHAQHAYDALVFAGAEPADIYVLDVRGVSTEVDVNGMLEALHRAGPQATFVALSDEQVNLPPYVQKIGRNDGAALKAIVAPDVAGQAPAAPAQSGEPPLAAGGVR